MMTDKISQVIDLNELGDKIANLIKISGVTVDSYWPKLFAKAIEGKNISEFFHFGSNTADANQTQSALSTANGAKTDQKNNSKKQQKEVEPVKEEEDEEAGMGGLFD